MTIAKGDTEESIQQNMRSLREGEERKRKRQRDIEEKHAHQTNKRHLLFQTNRLNANRMKSFYVLNAIKFFSLSLYLVKC